MIFGIGIDQVEIDRIRNTCESNRRFQDRIYTDYELEYCLSKRNPYPHLAARFAAKEALFKALGRRIVWKDVEVMRENSGKPYLKFKNPFDFELISSISLSHDTKFASAIVILEIK